MIKAINILATHLQEEEQLPFRGLSVLNVPFVLLYRMLGFCMKLAADGARSPEIIQPHNF